MLNFSSGIGKTILGGIVVLIIFAFALEFRAGSGSRTSSLATECVIELGRECLDSKDYFAAYGMVVPRGIQPKDARALGLKRRALDGLVERELLVAEGERLGLGVTDNALDGELMAGRAHVSLPAAELGSLAYRLGLCVPAQRDYGCEPGTPRGVRQLRVRRTPDEPFDMKLYEREIRLVANRGPKEFRLGQEREILAERVRELVRARVRVSEAEAYSVFERGLSKAVVRSVVLESSWFAKYVLDTSDEAVARYASTHAVEVEQAAKAEKPFSAGCPRVRELLVPLALGARDEDKGPLRERAAELRERVQKGEAFASVARATSAAKSAPFGGLVPCLNEAHGPAAAVLLEAASKLTPGGLSDVLEAPGGFYLLTLEGKLDAGAVEREARQKVARELYLKSSTRDALQAFASELTTKAKAGAKLEDLTRELTDALVRRAQKPGAKPAADAGDAVQSALAAPDRPAFEVSPPFTISGNPLPDVQAREPIAARAFELAPEALTEPPIETATGLLVLQLKEKTPASKEEFQKEKGALLRAMADRKGDEALARYVAELRRAAGSKLKIDERYAEEAKADANE
jgi:peptidyl-prolyl cis-trans isomerase D